MALNETAKHFYEKEVERLLGLDDVKIIKEKFFDMRSQIDDLYVELGERARRIAELESELLTAKKNLVLVSRIPTDADVGLRIVGLTEKEIEDVHKEVESYKSYEKKCDEDKIAKMEKKIAKLESEVAVDNELLKAVKELRKEEPLQFSDNECEKEAKIELPTMPIDVASMLINATVEYETNSFQKALGIGETEFADKYSKNDLREIAEHLLVYCNNSDEDEDDMQS